MKRLFRLRPYPAPPDPVLAEWFEEYRRAWRRTPQGRLNTLIVVFAVAALIGGVLFVSATAFNASMALTRHLAAWVGVLMLILAMLGVVAVLTNTLSKRRPFERGVGAVLHRKQLRASLIRDLALAGVSGAEIGRLIHAQYIRSTGRSFLIVGAGSGLIPLLCAIEASIRLSASSGVSWVLISFPIWIAGCLYGRIWGVGANLRADMLPLEWAHLSGDSRLAFRWVMLGLAEGFFGLIFVALLFAGPFRTGGALLELAIRESTDHSAYDQVYMRLLLYTAIALCVWLPIRHFTIINIEKQIRRLDELFPRVVEATANRVD